jgi:hypothetical protein
MKPLSSLFAPCALCNGVRARFAVVKYIVMSAPVATVIIMVVIIDI